MGIHTASFGLSSVYWKVKIDFRDVSYEIAKIKTRF